MHGENRARFVTAMKGFSEWAVRVAAYKSETDWVMPVKLGKRQDFEFSLEAYNYFAEHGKGYLKKLKNPLHLLHKIERYKKELYRGDGAIMVKKSRFFLLPNRL